MEDIKSAEFETNHRVCLPFRVKVQDVGDGDILITMGTGGCYSWNVLSRQDANELIKAILEVGK
jgi:hypothetical protein